MSMSLSSSSSSVAARDRRNRRIAAFQHRGRMFHHARAGGGGGAQPAPPPPASGSWPSSSSPTNASSSPPSTPATPSSTTETSVFDAPTLPSLPSPPPSPRPPHHQTLRRGQHPEGKSRSSSTTIMTFTSPRSPTSFALLPTSSSSSKNSKPPPAIPQSPALPCVSPSRSTDEGDDRPVPLLSSPPPPIPAPLQQPSLSPRFRFAPAAPPPPQNQAAQRAPGAARATQRPQERGATIFRGDGPRDVHGGTGSGSVASLIRRIESWPPPPLPLSTAGEDDDDQPRSEAAAAGARASAAPKDRLPAPGLRPRPRSAGAEGGGQEDGHRRAGDSGDPRGGVCGGAPSSPEGWGGAEGALLLGIDRRCQQEPRLRPGPGRLSLKKLAGAIRQGAAALPSDLSQDERGLWEAVLQLLARQDENPRLLRPASDCSPSSSSVAALASTFEHQRHGRTSPPSPHLPGRDVLPARGEAEGGAEKLRAVRDQRHEPSPPSTPPRAAAPPAADAGGSGGSERTIAALEAELTRRSRRIRELESELSSSQQNPLLLTPTKSPVSPPRQGKGDNSGHLSSPERSPTAATSRSGETDDGSSLASDGSSADVADDVVARLRGELGEKAAALENAKMIIASLESASGSLAADMRARVKSKDDELASVRAEMADKQRALDTLATHLRDVQRSQPHHSRCTRSREEERSRRLGLSGRLERNMADFRAALVVLESTTHDPAALELISHLLSDTVQAWKDGIEVLDEDLDAAAAADDAASGADARWLRKELDDKTRAVQRLEEALRREREECAKLLSERGRSDGGRGAELEALRVEVRSLKEQCCTNMEVLAKKERELVVLRDSLKVDDGVGYISDDGTDASETDADETPLSPVPRLLTYGPSQAEALATLLAQSSAGMGSKSSLSSDAAHELQLLKEELQQAHADLERYRKQLKTEKESLVNAKMIISSLEKANKSIMDDLRSRLQDSNTAITSLLEKSIENEKTNSKLRDEIEALKNEKARYEAEISALRSSYLDDRQSSLQGLLAPLEEKKDEKPETID